MGAVCNRAMEVVLRVIDVVGVNHSRHVKVDLILILKEQRNMGIKRKLLKDP